LVNTVSALWSLFPQLTKTGDFTNYVSGPSESGVVGVIAILRQLPPELRGDAKPRPVNPNSTNPPPSIERWVGMPPLAGVHFVSSRLFFPGPQQDRTPLPRCRKTNLEHYKRFLELPAAHAVRDFEFLARLRMGDFVVTTARLIRYDGEH